MNLLQAGLMRPWSYDEIEALPGHFYAKVLTVWNIQAEKK